jgi:glycerol-3-phosphate dehydrogenase (NAD(P)+)
MAVMQKDFWRKSKVAVIGGGSWGTVLAHLASKNCENVRVLVREEDRARQINATRENQDYVPDLVLNAKVQAYTDAERVFEGGVAAVIWAIPSGPTRKEARRLAPLFSGDELILHASKGIEEGSLKRVSEILREELPSPRIGVISGPNLALEIARGEPAGTVVASNFDEVVKAGIAILSQERFRVYSSRDVIGLEWAGALKNILAIASGAIEGLGFGANTRALLISRGLAEMVRFGVAMGGKQETFLGLAGVGDVLATCSSRLSRNYRVGMGLGQGKKLSQVIEELDSTAEGVRTTETIFHFSRERGIDMPIVEAVYRLIQGEESLDQVVQWLMTRPAAADAAMG